MEDILADSDSDLDGMDVDEPQVNKRKINTWIHEDADNIVDFTDPSTVSKITATKPGQGPAPTAPLQKNKDRGFKTSADGRLIIGDDSDSDDVGAFKRKLTIKLNSDTESGNVIIILIPGST